LKSPHPIILISISLKGPRQLAYWEQAGHFIICYKECIRWLRVMFGGAWGGLGENDGWRDGQARLSGAGSPLYGGAGSAAGAVRQRLHDLVEVAQQRGDARRLFPGGPAPLRLRHPADLY